MTGFDFSELERFDRNLQNAVRVMPRVGIKITANSAERMVGEAKRIVRIKTGRLQRSIRVIRKGQIGGRGQVGAEWGSDVTYAPYIEEGFIHWISGKKVGPFPYAAPALERYRKQWVDRIVKAAVKLIVGGLRGR